MCYILSCELRDTR